MNKLFKILILVMFIVSIASSIFSFLQYDENVKLKSDIEKRDKLLASTLNNDSSWIKRQDSIVKYVTKDLFFYFGNEKMNPEEFIRYVNSLHKQYEIIEDSLMYYKTYFKMTNKLHGGNFKVDKDGAKTVYQYSGIDVQSIDSALQSKSGGVYTLQKENIEMKLKLSMYQKAIDKYGIKFEEYKDNGKYLTFIIKASQVDSALILFPYFKDRLIYNKKKGYWEIKRVASH